MDQYFKKGYEFFIQNASANTGAFSGTQKGLEINQELEKIENVERVINNFAKAINSFEGSGKDPKSLSGDIAEFYHVGTYDVARAKEGLEGYGKVLRSTGFASVDAQDAYGKNYGLKYYKTAADSAKQQSKSVFELYKKNNNHSTEEDFRDFAVEKGLDYDDKYAPAYKGQQLIVPKDQLKDAKLFLNKKIESESNKRGGEQVARYKYAKEHLTDKIEDKDGISSTPLSKDKATEIAAKAKEGKFDPKDYGIEAPEFDVADAVIKEAMKAGTTAALLSMCLKVIPDIYLCVNQLCREGRIDPDKIVDTEKDLIIGAAEGFFRGSVAAAIMTCAKHGTFGEQYTDLDAGIVGSVIAITLRTIENGIRVAAGKKSRKEMADELARDIIIATCSHIAGGITQSTIQIPIFGYLVGSFIGSVIGQFAYSGAKTAVVSFCVDSGCTMFGLVEQDYTVPSEVLDSLNIDLIQYNEYQMNRFEYDSFIVDQLNYDMFTPETIGITTLKRGVYGVSKVAYVV